MTAFNVVRVRVKPGREKEFLEANRKSPTDFAGFKRFAMIKTGDRSYCIIGEWDSLQSLAAARPKMISMLDTFRGPRLKIWGAGSASPILSRARSSSKSKFRGARHRASVARSPLRRSP